MLQDFRGALNGWGLGISRLGHIGIDVEGISGFP